MRSALAIALLVGSILGSAGQARAQTLSNGERARLLKGELVVRPQARLIDGQQMIGGVAYQKVSLPPEAVWRAVLDTPRYHNLLPQVAEARLVTTRPRRRVVYLRHGTAPVSASYHVVIDVNHATRTANFRVDRTRPHALRSGWGALTVQPDGQGRSVISWSVLADIGSNLLTGILRPQIHQALLEVPRTIRRYVEGPGRSRYQT